MIKKILFLMTFPVVCYAGNMTIGSSGTGTVIIAPATSSSSGGSSTTTLISSGIAFGSSGNTVTQDTNSFTWNTTTNVENVLAGTLSIASGSYSSDMNKAGFVRVAKNYAFISGYSSNTITIFDISVATAPVRVSQIKTPGTTSGSEGIDIKWPYLYQVDIDSSSLNIYNIGSPGTPSLIGNVTDNNNLGGAEDVHVLGNYAYIVDFSAGYPNPSITIVDVSTPTNPVIASSVSIQGLPPSTAVQLLMDYPYAYLSGGGCSIYAINISTPTSPVVSSTYNVVGCTNRITGADFYGKYLYLGGFTDNQLYVANISTPGSITNVRVVNTGSHTPWVLHTYGNKLDMTSINDNSVLQYSLVNPSSPTLINSIQDNTFLNVPDDLWMSGTQMYVTTHGASFNGCGFTILNMGGIQTNTIQAGTAKIDNLQVDHELDAGILNVQNGIQTPSAGVGNLSMNVVRGAGLNTCGDSGHGLSFSKSTGQFGCQSITGTASSPGGSPNNIQYNNAGNFGGISYINTGSTNSIIDTGYGGISISSGTSGTGAGTALNIAWSNGGSGSGGIAIPITITNTNSSQNYGMQLKYLNPNNSSLNITAMDITADDNGNGFPATALQVTGQNGSPSRAINISSGDIELNGSAGSTGQVLTSQGSGIRPIWSTVSSGGGSSTLATSLGTSNNPSPIISSPTAIVNFDNRTTSGTLQGNGTYFFTLLPSSVTLQGQNVIDLTSSLQNGSTFYVSSGTIGTSLYIAGDQYIKNAQHIYFQGSDGSNGASLINPYGVGVQYIELVSNSGIGINVANSGFSGLSVNGISATAASILQNTTFYSTVPSTNSVVVMSTNNVPVFAVSNSSVTPGDFMLSIASGTGSASTLQFGVNTYGHVVSSGPIPSVSSCGTSPSMDGNSTDFAGTINTGSASPTACTLTFSNPFLNVPVCVVSDDLQTSEPAVTSRSTTAITVTLSAALSSGHIFYICVGEKG